jgi:hypothetical protein
LGTRERAYLALTADPEEIRDVVRFLAECGIAKAAVALRELDPILEAI